VKIPEGFATLNRRARIELMIEFHRRARQRRLMRLAMRMWRRTATEQQLARLGARPARIH
jgi:hypothetical protein